MIRISFSTIMGVQVGFELYEQEVYFEKEDEPEVITYLLIDFLILRLQLAWYQE